MTTRTLMLATIAFTTLAACSSKSSGTSAASSDSAAKAAVTVEGSTPKDTAGVAGMQGMQGMSGMQGAMGSAMMDSMRAEVGRMQGRSGDQMKTMLSMHRQMAANMLAQMSQEMRSRNMSATPAWTVTVDSLRLDLTRVPELSGAELKAMMPAHMARMTRLIEMHQTMMQQMPKR